MIYGLEFIDNKCVAIHSYLNEEEVPMDYIPVESNKISEHFINKSYEEIQQLIK